MHSNIRYYHSNSHTAIHTLEVAVYLLTLFFYPARNQEVHAIALLFYFSDSADFTEGTYTVSFAEGTEIPFNSCVSIPTTEDTVLEGDHDFSVAVVSVTPNDAVTFDPAETHVVTIIDNDGMYGVVYNTNTSFHCYYNIMYIGVAILTLQATPSPLDEGTSHMCCVAISGLPADGLGCDIDVELDVFDITAGIYHDPNMHYTGMR